MLILLLVVPVLIFLFLKGFATNHFDLPYYVPLKDSTTNEVVTSNGDTVFYQISASSFTQGAKSTTGALNGKTIVFGALSLPCGDSCEQMLAKLSRVAKLNEEYPEFRVVSLVNEKDELPSTIKGQAGVSKAWQVLSVQNSIYEHYVTDLFRLTEKIPGQKTISLDNRFILIDKSRYIRGYYDLRDPEELERLLVEIKVLEYNREENK